MISIIILLIFVAVTGLTIFNLRKGIQLYIVLFPFLQPYVVLDLGSFHYPLQSILTVIIFAAIVIKTFINKKKAANIKTNFFSKPVLSFTFLLFLTVLINWNIIDKNLVNFLFMFLQKLSILYIGWMAFDTIKNGEKLFEKLLKIAFVIAVYGFIEYLFKSNPIIDIFANDKSGAISDDSLLRYTVDDDRGYRIQAVFYHAYSWGGYLLILSSSYLYMVFNAKSNTSYYKYALIYMLIFFNVFFTRSRSCFIPTIIMIGSMLWITPSSKKKTQFIGAIILGAITAMAVSPQLFDSFKKYFTFSEEEGTVRGSSTEMRLGQLISSLAMIKDKYVGGSGFGAVKKLLHDIGSDSDLKGAESIWFVVLIDNGLIGVVAYILLYTNIIRRFLKMKKQALTKPVSQKITLAIITVICYIVFITLTGEMNTFPFFMLYLGMFGKLIFLQIQEDRKNLVYDQYLAINEPAIDGSAAA